MNGRILGIKIGETFVPCEMSCDISIDGERIATSSKENGNWRNSIAGYRSWKASVNGKFQLDESEGSEAGSLGLIQAIIDGVNVELVMTLRIDITQSLLIGGIAGTTNITISGASTGDATWTGTFDGVGLLDLDYNFDNGYLRDDDGDRIVDGAGRGIVVNSGNDFYYPQDASKVSPAGTKILVADTNDEIAWVDPKDISENSLTNSLKNAYDNAVNWIATNGGALLAHLLRTDNPHNVTKAQVGLGNADDTSDLNKPISNATKEELDENYVSNDNIKEYLNLDFSHLGGIVNLPADRASTTFTATPLNPVVSYFEPELFFGGNISVNKIYIKSPVVGQVYICFIQVIGADVQVLYAEQKNIVIGINTFELSEFSIPHGVMDLPKINIGLSERGSPVGTASILANPGGNLRAALNNGLNPIITLTGNILNLWAEINTVDFLIGGYKKIDYLSTYEPPNIYTTINPKDGINDFTGGVADTSYFGDGLQVLTPKQKLVNFYFKSTTEGEVEILFVSYPSCVVVHTATMPVVANTTYIWTPSDLALPDLSAYPEVYTFLHNTDPDIMTATVKLSSSGIGVSLSTFVPSVPQIQFDNNSIYRVAYWMDVVNDNADIVDQLEDIQSKVNASEVGTYDELLIALNSQKIITLKDGVIEVEDTIDVPYGTTIQGSKKAILQAGVGVDVVIRLAAEDVCLDGFTLIGNGADVDINSDSIIDLPIDIEQYPTNLGTGIGILCYKGSGTIKNLRIRNFDRSGIEIQNTFINVGEFPKGFNIEGVVCQNNYFGIRTTPYGEYSRISDVNCMRNVCGISVVSGNIAVSNSHFTQNRIGAHIGAKYELITVDETNNAHGGFNNCFFNHNALRGIYIVNITNGQIITDCNYFDGIIEFNNSIGAVIMGGIIASEIIVTSNSNQLSMISNCVFRSDGGNNAGVINKTGAGRLSMFGNRYSTGKDDTLLNQEL